jgi:hypothetical protein
METQISIEANSESVGTKGISDEPVSVSSGDPQTVFDDALGRGPYIRALAEFIRATETPFTIGIQGKWGSGKTSLLKKIQGALEQGQGRYKYIWVNAWEYSLLASPEEALVEIAEKLIYGVRDVVRPGWRATWNVRRILNGVTRGALRISARSISSGLYRMTDGILGRREASIGELKNKFGELCQEMVNGRASRLHRWTNGRHGRGAKGKYEKVVIFIDDLDRIEPKDAVRTLDLLKNIFSVEHCVSVLAIELEVVRRGLQYKFGEKSPENEKEFDSYFHKIIQLPFSMPAERNIAKFALKLFCEVRFLGSPNELTTRDVTKLLELSLGRNARAVKRLANSLGLISRLMSELDEEKKRTSREEIGGVELWDGLDVRKRNLLLIWSVCVQDVFPAIHEALVEDPDFKKWDEKFAKKQGTRGSNRDPIFKEAHDEFARGDEARTGKRRDDWEVAAFTIAYESAGNRDDVSELLAHATDIILKGESGSAHPSLISKAVSVAGVTIVQPPQRKSQPRQYLEVLAALRELNALDPRKEIKKEDLEARLEETDVRFYRIRTYIWEINKKTECKVESVKEKNTVTGWRLVEDGEAADAGDAGAAGQLSSPMPDVAPQRPVVAPDTHDGGAHRMKQHEKVLAVLKQGDPKAGMMTEEELKSRLADADLELYRLSTYIADINKLTPYTVETIPARDGQEKAYCLTGDP